MNRNVKRGDLSAKAQAARRNDARNVAGRKRRDRLFSQKRAKGAVSPTRLDGHERKNASPLLVDAALQSLQQIAAMMQQENTQQQAIVLLRELFCRKIVTPEQAQGTSSGADDTDGKRVVIAKAIETGLLQYVMAALSSAHSPSRKEASLTLTHITTTASPAEAPALLESIPLLLRLSVEDDDLSTKANAVWSLGNFACDASEDCRRHLLLENPTISTLAQVLKQCISTLSTPPTTNITSISSSPSSSSSTSDLTYELVSATCFALLSMLRTSRHAATPIDPHEAAQLRDEYAVSQVAQLAMEYLRTQYSPTRLAQHAVKNPPPTPTPTSSPSQGNVVLSPPPRHVITDLQQAVASHLDAGRIAPSAFIGSVIDATWLCATLCARDTETFGLLLLHNKGADVLVSLATLSTQYKRSERYTQSLATAAADDTALPSALQGDGAASSLPSSTFPLLPASSSFLPLVTGAIFDTVSLPALRVLGNVCSGPNAFADSLLRASSTSGGGSSALLGALLLLFDSPYTTLFHRGLRKEVAWLMCNLTACSPLVTDGVCQYEGGKLVVGLCELFVATAFDVRKDCAFALWHLIVAAKVKAKEATPTNDPVAEVLVALLQLDGVLWAMMDLLRVRDVEANDIGLKLVEAVLAHHPSGVSLVENAEGIDALEALETHGNEELYRHASALVDRYYGEDYDDGNDRCDQASVPAVFDFGGPPADLPAWRIH
eukprot:TRINITY_DN7381_c0_g1_i1.p1 TRINITY_DN7381_c0_g1~~TRINITY_DN7381_c0_g1_i1.p1  ORF type:complete len:719 (+),score=172.66 TRINITY_DN7381_c0_g1_i1:156-2312(+)